VHVRLLAHPVSMKYAPKSFPIAVSKN